MSDDQQFCLRWNNFQTNFTSQFKALRVDEDFVDVTLACEGKRIKAHKLVLSACSPYFKELFKGNPCKHPIIFMQDVEYEHLMNLVEFMYAGQVNICQTKLPNFLHTAESLQIRGLSAQSQNKLPQTSEDRSEELRPGPSLGDSPDMESRGSSPDQALDEEGEGETSLPSKRLRESTSYNDVPTTALIETKMEPMDYYSDGEIQPTTSHNSMLDHPVGASRGYTMQGTFDAAASISAQISQLHEASQEQMQDIRLFLDQPKQYITTPGNYRAGRRRRADSPFRLMGRHFPQYVTSASVNKKNPQRQCIVCGKTSLQQQRRKESRFMCGPCNVGLCLVPCFEIYHTQPIY
ncbi:protein bric-a-brac 2-like isoform X3 [Macrosteles quadrilineatus]|uniref:protein bric-a-brac 2-like isoform X3 n=1 Tax=Macrosteles quadrilineatus TaxID=74068 RepID=UPI0023E16716|nr:protein bric-a-brac 2-like isoform X3 [Macrosteles quadrilineatus]